MLPEVKPDLWATPALPHVCVGILRVLPPGLEPTQGSPAETHLIAADGPPHPVAAILHICRTCPLDDALQRSASGLVGWEVGLRQYAKAAAHRKLFSCAVVMWACILQVEAYASKASCEAAWL